MAHSNENKDKLGLGERISKMLDISPEIFSKESVIELHGQSLLKIRGGGRILLYTPDEIRVELRRGKRFVSVCGRDLCCNSYNMGVVGIGGRIYSITFGRTEDGNKNDK